MPEQTITVVRCPACGSTDAGESEAVYEFTRMMCDACGLEDLCDEEDIKDTWNVKHVRRRGDQTLPLFIAPLAPEAADDGRLELDGTDGDETRLLVDARLGYAVTIPGHPRRIAPIAGTTGRAAILALADPPIELIVRIARAYSQDPAEAVIAAATKEAAETRARASRAGRAGRDLELVSCTVAGVPQRYRVACVLVRRTGAVDHTAFERIRTAIIASQRWSDLPR